MLDELEKILEAVGDKNRLRILNVLQTGELCVCQLVAILNLSQSTVSAHLSILKKARLIEEVPRGKWTYCRLATKQRSDALDLLMVFIALQLQEDPVVAEDARLARYMQHQKIETVCETLSLKGRHTLVAQSKREV